MVYWYYLVLASSLLMGLSTITEKRLLKAEHATAYSTAFSTLIALFSLLFLPFAKFNIKASDVIIIYIISVINAASYLTTARTYKHSNISIVSPINSSIPVLFTVIFAVLFLGESLSVLQYFCIGVITSVTYLLVFVTPKNESSFDSPKYKYILIANTMVIAAGGVASKYVLATINPFAFLILLEFFIALNFNILLGLRYGGAKELVREISNHRIPLLLITVFTLGYRLLYYVALVTAPISIASPLRNTIFVIMTIFAGNIIFKENALYKRLALSAILLLATYFLIV
ncbi:MAG: EamA family transporter [Candidatus Micrarchaeia archaeon]